MLDAQRLPHFQTRRNRRADTVRMCLDPSRKALAFHIVCAQVTADRIQRRKTHDTSYKRSGRQTDRREPADLANHAVIAHAKQFLCVFYAPVEQNTTG